MTTITVAHRVKTIMNSEMIYVFDKGGIAEKENSENFRYQKIMLKNNSLKIRQSNKNN